MFIINILAIVLAFVGTSFAENRTSKDDKVASLDKLPGWPNNTSFGIYSGYIQVENTTKNIHYVFLESQTVNNTSDPIMIWFNGGPGCSSMLGFLQETGPYVLEENATTYTFNEFAWNREVNMLYIEQPAGVGYSTCDNETAPTDCNHTDNSSSIDNLKVLNGWYDRFKDKADYKKNPLYISGESYGGIYVPLLAFQINEWNKAHQAQAEAINLKGFMVGNGVTNWLYDTYPATVDQLYYRSMFATDVMSEIHQQNCNFSGLAYGDTSNYTPKCGMLLETALKSLNGVNIYNLYGTCYGYNASFNATNFTAEEHRQKWYGKTVVNGVEHEYRKFFTADEYTPWIPKFRRKGLKDGNETYGIPGCIWALPAAEHLNNIDVQKQLNIKDPIVWRMCTTENSTFSYWKNSIASQWAYVALKDQIRMMHFTGDMDGSVPTIGTERWMNNLGWPVSSKWQPHFEFGQVAGYHETFDNALTLITVHGAGHMVPQDQRSRAYRILFNWLFERGEFLPPKNDTTTMPVEEPVADAAALEAENIDLMQW